MRLFCSRNKKCFLLFYKNYNDSTLLLFLFSFISLVTEIITTFTIRYRPLQIKKKKENYFETTLKKVISVYMAKLLSFRFGVFMDMLRCFFFLFAYKIYISVNEKKKNKTQSNRGRKAFFSWKNKKKGMFSKVFQDAKQTDLNPPSTILPDPGVFPSSFRVSEWNPSLKKAFMFWPSMYKDHLILIYAGISLDLETIFNQHLDVDDKTDSWSALI